MLTSPGSCGPNKTTAVMTPWTGNSAATPSGEFSLSTAPGGGKCAKTLADRPFAPSFAADTNKPAAGEFSPLHMNIARTDGNQELKGVDVTLPPGLVAKLAGVKYCPGNVLAAAAANSGAAEAADSSCPSSSLIGHADIVAGSGPSPLHVSGKVFLSGRYKGAPLSLAVITPATAGPFDLGTVVVRVALSLEPRTARVHAVSDPIPHVYGGSLLDVRSVSVKLDRDNFTLNPTNCSKLSFGGALLGGGANPVDPAAFTRVAHLGALRSERLRQARLPAQALAAPDRCDAACQEPPPARRPDRTAGRREHRPRPDDPAPLADPRPGQPGEGLHPRPVRRRRLPEKLDLRQRRRDLAAARRPAARARSTCAPPTTSYPTSSPTCAARSRSSSTAAPTAATAAFATPSTSSPTCR